MWSRMSGARWSTAEGTDPHGPGSRLPEAKEALKASMADGGEDVSRLFGYAAVLMQSGEYDQAIENLRERHAPVCAGR